MKRRRRRSRRNPISKTDYLVGGGMVGGGLIALAGGGAMSYSEGPNDHSLLGQNFGPKLSLMVFGMLAAVGGAGYLIGAHYNHPKLGAAIAVSSLGVAGLIKKAAQTQSLPQTSSGS